MYSSTRLPAQPAQLLGKDARGNTIQPCARRSTLPLRLNPQPQDNIYEKIYSCGELIFST